MTTPPQPSNGAAAAAPAPLTPPSGAATLTLEAPDAPPRISATEAPAMAPKIDQKQVPALDAKVTAFLDAMVDAETRSPEFAQQAEHVRSMGDADIRKAAETSSSPARPSRRVGSPRAAPSARP